MSDEDKSDRVIRIRPVQTQDVVEFSTHTLPPWKKDFRGFSGTLGNREDSGKDPLEIIQNGIKTVSLNVMDVRRRDAVSVGGRRFDTPETQRRLKLIDRVCTEIQGVQLKNPDLPIEKYVYILDLKSLQADSGYSSEEIMEIIHFFMIKEGEPVIEPFHDLTIETYPTVLTNELQLEEVRKKTKDGDTLIVAHIVGRLSKEAFRRENQ